MPRSTFRVVGVMSGSSLDGLDVAACRFVFDPEVSRPVAEWSVERAETFPFGAELTDRLRGATAATAYELMKLDVDLGNFVGRTLAAFLVPAAPPQLIGSHGHTVFHDPQGGFTTQIGCGATIAQLTGVTTVTQLRGSDVAAGGQGAPIAPLADVHLFANHRAFLNLGGIANFSCRDSAEKLWAGDVSGSGQILDRLANQLGHRYDDGGKIAAGGNYQEELATRFAAWPYHNLAYPKSLGNTEVQNELFALVSSGEFSTADRLHTFTIWLANKIVADLDQFTGAAKTAVLVTGGGAYNDFLLKKMNEAGGGALTFERPDSRVVEFKEAALVALAALFRFHGLKNALAAATGAAKNTTNGAIYSP